MKEAYIILDGQIIEAKMTYRHHNSDLVNVIYTDGDLLKHIELPIEAVYPDRETPEKILKKWKQYETPIIEEV